MPTNKVKKLRRNLSIDSPFNYIFGSNNQMLLLLTYTSLAKRFFKCESVNLTTVDNKTQKHIFIHI